MAEPFEDEQEQYTPDQQERRQRFRAADQIEVVVGDSKGGSLVRTKLPAAEATRALLEGRARFETGKTYFVQTPEGEKRKIVIDSQEQASGLATDLLRGYTFLTPLAAERAEAEEDGTLTALGSGALDLLPGANSAVAAASSEEDVFGSGLTPKDRLILAREAHPIATMAGTAAGAIGATAAAVATGGMSLGATVAARAGLGAAAQAAAGAGLVGGTISASMGISDDILYDDEVTASGVLLDFALGASVDAALAGGGALLASRKAAKLATGRGTQGKLPGAAADALARAAGVDPNTVKASLRARIATRGNKELAQQLEVVSKRPDLARMALEPDTNLAARARSAARATDTADNSQQALFRKLDRTVEQLDETRLNRQMPADRAVFSERVGKVLSKLPAEGAGDDLRTIATRTGDAIRKLGLRETPAYQAIRPRLNAAAEAGDIPGLRSALDDFVDSTAKAGNRKAANELDKVLAETFDVQTSPAIAAVETFAKKFDKAGTVGGVRKALDELAGSLEKAGLQGKGAEVAEELRKLRNSQPLVGTRGERLLDGYRAVRGQYDEALNRWRKLSASNREGVTDPGRLETIGKKGGAGVDMAREALEGLVRASAQVDELAKRAGVKGKQLGAATRSYQATLRKLDDISVAHRLKTMQSSLHALSKKNFLNMTARMGASAMTGDLTGFVASGFADDFAKRMFNPVTMLERAATRNAAAEVTVESASKLVKALTRGKDAVRRAAAQAPAAVWLGPVVTKAVPNNPYAKDELSTTKAVVEGLGELRRLASQRMELETDIEGVDQAVNAHVLDSYRKAWQAVGADVPNDVLTGAREPSRSEVRRIRERMTGLVYPQAVLAAIAAGELVSRESSAVVQQVYPGLVRATVEGVEAAAIDPELSEKLKGLGLSGKRALAAHFGMLHGDAGQLNAVSQVPERVQTNASGEDPASNAQRQQQSVGQVSRGAIQSKTASMITPNVQAAIRQAGRPVG